MFDFLTPINVARLIRLKFRIVPESVYSTKLDDHLDEGKRRPLIVPNAPAAYCRPLEAKGAISSIRGLGAAISANSKFRRCPSSAWGWHVQQRVIGPARAAF